MNEENVCEFLSKGMKCRYHWQDQTKVCESRAQNADKCSLISSGFALLMPISWSKCENLANNIITELGLGTKVQTKKKQR